jgi:hypothetical protein
MNRFTLLVGIERDGNGAQLDAQRRSEAMGALRSKAAEEFGGYTLSNAVGGWVNGDGVLVEEGAVRLDVYTQEPRGVCADFASWAGRLFGQTAVVFEFTAQPDVAMLECAP